MSTFMCLHFRCVAAILKCYTAFHISFMSYSLFACIFVALVADIRFSCERCKNHALWLPLKSLYQHSRHTVVPKHPTGRRGQFFAEDKV